MKNNQKVAKYLRYKQKNINTTSLISKPAFFQRKMAQIK